MCNNPLQTSTTPPRGKETHHKPPQPFGVSHVFTFQRVTLHVPTFSQSPPVVSLCFMQPIVLLPCSHVEINLHTHLSTYLLTHTPPPTHAHIHTLGKEVKRTKTPNQRLFQTSPFRKQFLAAKKQRPKDKVRHGLACTANVRRPTAAHYEAWPGTGSLPS